MNTLAIETSGKMLGLALAQDGKIKAEFFGEAGHTHSERLLPELGKLLRKAKWNLRDLDKVAVSVGPGSFTGIRIGLVCARVLAQELKIPLVGIDALSILEAGVPACGALVAPAIDALRDEVYVRGQHGIEIQSAEKFFKALAKRKGKVVVAGNATAVFADMLNKLKLNSAGPEFIYPRAGTLALLAEKLRGEKYDKVLPVYVRKSWAEENKNKNRRDAKSCVSTR
jgi:tRNA threonylcarbamoyladenosine biosynthesis protein TsaB